jgi:hypothetical protein
MRTLLLPGLLLAACALAACGGEEQPAPDLLPPGILRSEPAADATGVALDVVVRVWLDEPFDNSRLSSDHMYLRQGVTPLYGSLSRDTAQSMLALDLSVLLEAGQTYEVVLSPGVCDLAPAPNCTRAPLTFSFQTLR